MYDDGLFASAVVTTQREPTSAHVRSAEELVSSLSRIDGFDAVYAARDAAVSHSQLLARHRERALLIVGRAGTSLHAHGLEHRLHANTAAKRLRMIAAGDGDWLLTACALREGDVFVDATAGLLGDSLVAASAVGDEGRVVAIESSPLLYAVSSGRPPSLGDGAADAAIGRINVVCGDHTRVLESMADASVDVVYFDVMFRDPAKASVGYDALRLLADHRPLSTQALTHAKRVARRRVVVMDASGGRELERLQLPISHRSQNKRYGVLVLDEARTHQAASLPALASRGTAHAAAAAGNAAAAAGNAAAAAGKTAARRMKNLERREIAAEAEAVMREALTKVGGAACTGLDLPCADQTQSQARKQAATTEPPVHVREHLVAISDSSQYTYSRSSQYTYSPSSQHSYSPRVPAAVCEAWREARGALAALMQLREAHAENLHGTAVNATVVQLRRVLNAAHSAEAAASDGGVDSEELCAAALEFAKALRAPFDAPSNEAAAFEAAAFAACDDLRTKLRRAGVSMAVAEPLAPARAEAHTLEPTAAVSEGAGKCVVL